MLMGRQKAYSEVLLLVSTLSLMGAIVGYLNKGLVLLTIAYFLLSLVGLIRGAQAYRST